MKKNNYFLLALAGLTLASCSSDEVTDVNPGNAIEFQTVVGKSTRAEFTTDGNNSTTALSEFKVWAFVTDADQAFMNGATVTKKDGVWGYGATQYWPKNNVTFYAVAPTTFAKTATISIAAGAQTIKSYTIADNAKEDLIYAKTDPISGKANPSVKLQFKHALSKIQFTASLQNEATIDVTIKSIQVAGVANVGTFSFGSGWGTISTTETKPVYTAYTNTGANLRDNSITTLHDELFLMPQTLTSWNTENASTQGAQIIVDLVVKDHNSGAQIYAGKVYVPLKGDTTDNKWAAGTKYVYNLVFGQGAGFDENGNPVLVPVTLDVEVSDFSEGTTTDPSMY